jgi:transposase-like protein
MATGQRRRTVEDRAEVVARYVESGLTQRVFARKEGIGVSTLQLWLRQVGANEESLQHEPSCQRAGPGRAEALRLLEVELAGGSAPSRGAVARYTVELPCGMRLHLEADFTASEVRRLLLVMKEVS